mmetsp:Transcript_620/g.2517  ORF Transcript_620/g.2517 Transcript_620/m.2517 type:complete len:326 (+) Transcript_620:83-1060(+)
MAGAHTKATNEAAGPRRLGGVAHDGVEHALRLLEVGVCLLVPPGGVGLGVSGTVRAGVSGARATPFASLLVAPGRRLPGQGGRELCVGLLPGIGIGRLVAGGGLSSRDGGGGLSNGGVGGVIRLLVRGLLRRGQSRAVCTRSAELVPGGLPLGNVGVGRVARRRRGHACGDASRLGDLPRQVRRGRVHGVRVASRHFRVDRLGQPLQLPLQRLLLRRRGSGDLGVRGGLRGRGRRPGWTAAGSIHVTAASGAGAGVGVGVCVGVGSWHVACPGVLRAAVQRIHHHADVLRGGGCVATDGRRARQLGCKRLRLRVGACLRHARRGR